MRQPDSSQIFVAFDTETTGLSPVGDRVVEIAAVAFCRDGSILDAFEHLVDPGIPIPPALAAIHGITDEMVAGRPPIEELLPEFVRFIGDNILVAHNAPYDVSMLLMPLVRMAHIVRASGPCFLQPPGNLVLDTCTLSRATFPGAPNYRLGTVADLLGILRGRAHHAMSDVGACKEIFLRILDRCAPDVSLEELIRLNGSRLHLGIPEELVVAMPGAEARTAMLRGAIRTASPILIEYHGGTKGAGPRLVTPITLMAQGEAVFLVAHCHLDGGLKKFRLDRVAAIYPPPAS